MKGLSVYREYLPQSTMLMQYRNIKTYLTALKFWPIIMNADMDDMWGALPRLIKYTIYNDIANTVQNLTTTLNVDTTFRTPIQPIYNTFPNISKVVICTTAQRSTGTGLETNTCVADATCNSTTKFCLDATKLFWCSNSTNNFLGIIKLITFLF